MNNTPNGRPPAFRAVITGYGSFAPAKTLSNDELGKMVETSDEWIATRTGIKIRHITSDSESTALLATEAAKKALAQANLDPGELDIIQRDTILATQYLANRLLDCSATRPTCTQKGPVNVEQCNRDSHRRHCSRRGFS